MAFEYRDGQGSLFTNTRKATPNHPDFTGKLKLNGKMHWVSGWMKEGSSGPWMSMEVNEMDDSQQESLPSQAKTANDFFQKVPTSSEQTSQADSECPF